MILSTQSLKNILSFSQNRIPAQLVIQMTNHCNAHCPQCSMRTMANIPRSQLAGDEVKRILDSAGNKGSLLSIHSIALSSGNAL